MPTLNYFQYYELLALLTVHLHPLALLVSCVCPYGVLVYSLLG